MRHVMDNKIHKLLDSDLTKFWISLRDEYPELSELLIPFITSFLSEMGFSSQVKSKHRNRLDAHSDL